jgi:dolichol-phosphate mannosyltransferase
VLQEVIAEHGQDFFDQTGFQCMVDILLKLRRRDLIFGEVPFVLRYDLKEGESKMNVGKTIRDTLRLIARRRIEG